LFPSFYKKNKPYEEYSGGVLALSNKYVAYPRICEIAIGVNIPLATTYLYI